MLELSRDIVGRTVALLSAWKTVEMAQYYTSPGLFVGPQQERYPYQSTAELMPVQHFVLQMLLRSRADFLTLETALCYTATITTLLPALVQEEHDMIYATYDYTARIRPPSALLCPRRTLVAALIVAWKFWHDNAYSNKAWVTITGLPLREITLCERLLCEALSYRFWVRPEPLTQNAGIAPVVTTENFYAIGMHSSAVAVR
ncbi:hypothetical protein AURDEDRAFT_172530 [Auricularia subglabra TFB-10046 SS5]|nr:hypothetical protein AURDEDRAFT_172530 [Auricularia subglabra TFB-10046 SS5]